MLAQNDSFSLIVPHSTSIHKKDDALAGTRLSPHTKTRDIVSHLPDPTKRPSLARRRRYRRRNLFISSWSAQEQVPAVASSSGADLTWSLEETYLGDTCFDWDSFTTLTTPPQDLEFEFLETTDNRLLDTSTDGNMPMTATSSTNVMEPAALQSMMDGTATGDFYDSYTTSTAHLSSSQHGPYSSHSSSTSQQSPLFPSPNLTTSKASTSTRHSPSSEGSAESKVCKRQRNTEAARRYRQRKVDRVMELEEALAAMQKERDELKLKLARSEAEAEVLKRLHAK